MAFDVKEIADISVPNVSPAELSVKESNGKRCAMGLNQLRSGEHVRSNNSFLLQEPAVSELMLTSPETWQCGSVL